MRTFIAIKIKPEALLLEKLSALKQELSEEHIKWVDEQNYHLTLKFLGETSEEQVMQVKNILADYAALQQPVSFTLSGLGFFKSRGMPRVLYIDIHKGEALKLLAEGMETLLASLGFKKEERPFNPHLTLARIKYIKDKKRFYQALESYPFASHQPLTVNDIIFYQSSLQPSGPVYNELAKFSLQGRV